jgi:hypothetical protein
VATTEQTNTNNNNKQPASQRRTTPAMVISNYVQPGGCMTKGGALMYCALDATACTLTLVPNSSNNGGAFGGVAETVFHSSRTMADHPAMVGACQQPDQIHSIPLGRCTDPDLDLPICTASASGCNSPSWFRPNDANCTVTADLAGDGTGTAASSTMYDNNAGPLTNQTLYGSCLGSIDGTNNNQGSDFNFCAWSSAECPNSWTVATYLHSTTAAATAPTAPSSSYYYCDDCTKVRTGACRVDDGAASDFGVYYCAVSAQACGNDASSTYLSVLELRSEVPELECYLCSPRDTPDATTVSPGDVTDAAAAAAAAASGDTGTPTVSATAAPTTDASGAAAAAATPTPTATPAPAVGVGNPGMDLNGNGIPDEVEDAPPDWNSMNDGNSDPWQQQQDTTATAAVSTDSRFTVAALAGVLIPVAMLALLAFVLVRRSRQRRRRRCKDSDNNVHDVCCLPGREGDTERSSNNNNNSSNGNCSYDDSTRSGSSSSSRDNNNNHTDNMIMDDVDLNDADADYCREFDPTLTATAPIV